MHSVRVVHVLIFVLTTALLAEEGYAQSNQRRRQRNRAQVRGSDGLPSELQQAYLSAVDDDQSEPSLQPSENENIGSESIRSGNADWGVYVPSTPAAYAVECNVEIITRRLRGGRCTRLGGMNRPFICQSGAHFEFNPECERIMNDRTQPES